MVKVFLTGATGFIGAELALALRRAGHQVFGLVRDANKPIAIKLQEEEVSLVVGDLLHPETYADVAKQAEVLIHTAMDFANYGKADGTLIDVFTASSSVAQRKIAIFTSGILVYPESRDKIHDENDALDQNLLPLLQQRVAYEQAILKAPTLSGVVVRPSFVFGKNSSNFYQYFEQALRGKVVVGGDPDITWSEVHVDDLVDGYVRIVEASPAIVAGQVFNFADGSRNSNRAIAERFARVAGFKGEIEVDLKAGHPFFNKSSLADWRKASRVLGWKPNHRGLLDEAELYFATWKALEKKKRDAGSHVVGVTLSCVTFCGHIKGLVRATLAKFILPLDVSVHFHR